MSIRSRKGFTLVELLVVIGIIAVLLGFLLPVLASARNSGNTIKCSANLRSIGQALQEYLDENGGAFPPSNYYTGTVANVPAGIQTPSEPVSGYVHWSALLNFHKDINTTDPFTGYLSTKGWEMYQCPALLNGGLPPANTYAGNNDGLSDESPGIIDRQAPRLAYTVNEELCPRGIFIPFFDSRNNVRVYHFVHASIVKDSANTILASELWGSQNVATTTSLIDGETIVSNSRRPVNGISALSGVNPDKAYQLPYTANYVFAQPRDMHTDPETQIQPGGSVQSVLDYVGRNHGNGKQIGHVAGDTRGGWDLRKSNFLYVDGHVETKHISETVYPLSQWSIVFYTLSK